MALIIRRAPFQVTAGLSSGTFTVTHPDLTSPDCGIVFVSGATDPLGIARIHARQNMGFFENRTNQRSAASRWRHGLNSSNTQRGSSAIHIIQNIADTSTSEAGTLTITDTVVPGGIELSYSSAFQHDLLGYVLFFEGVVNSHLDHSPNINGGTAVIGFKPDILFLSSAVTPNDIRNNGIIQYGVCCRRPSDDAITQFSLATDNLRSSSTVMMAGGLKEGCCIYDVRAGDLRVEYRLESFNADGYKFEGVGMTLNDVRQLAIQFPPENQPICGIHALSSTTGADTIPTAYEAGPNATEGALFWGWDLATQPTTIPLAHESMLHGVCDAKLGQSASTACDDYGNSTTQASSAYRPDRVIHDVFADTWSPRTNAECVGMGPDIDLNIINNDGVGNLIGYIAIQGVASAQIIGELTDAMSASDAKTAIAHRIGAVVESMSGGDNTPAVGHFSEQRADTGDAADQIIALSHLLEAVSDAMQASDQRDGVTAAIGQLTETLQAGDILGARAAISATVTELLNVIELREGDTAVSGSLSDSASIGDQLAAIVHALRDRSDTMTANDVLTGLVTLIGQFSDTLVALDQRSARAAISASHSSTASISDFLVGETSDMGARSDLASGSDVRIAISHIRDLLIDSLSALDQPRAIAHYAGSLIDTMFVSDVRETVQPALRAIIVLRSIVDTAITFRARADTNITFTSTH